jgi:hypothetical protein
LLGELFVAIPDRDGSTRIEHPFDDGAADALRAAGDDGRLAREINPVGHVAFLAMGFRASVTAVPARLAEVNDARERHWASLAERRARP